MSASKSKPKPKSSSSVRSSPTSSQPSPSSSTKSSKKRARDDSAASALAPLVPNASYNTSKSLSKSNPTATERAGKRARTEAPLAQRLLALTTPSPRTLADPEETPWEGAVTFDYDGADDTAAAQTRQFLAAPTRAPLRHKKGGVHSSADHNNNNNNAVTDPEAVGAMTATAMYKGTRTSRKALREDGSLVPSPLKALKTSKKAHQVQESEESEGGEEYLGDSDDSKDIEVDFDQEEQDEEADSMDLDLEEDSSSAHSSEQVAESEEDEEEAESESGVSLTRQSSARSVAATVARAGRTREQHATYEAVLQLRLALQPPMSLVRQLPSPLVSSSSTSEVCASLNALLSDLTALQSALPLPETRTDSTPTRTLATALTHDLHVDEDQSSLSDSDTWWSVLSSRQSHVDEAVKGALEAWHAQSAGAATLRSLNASPVAQVDAMLAHVDTRNKLLARAMSAQHVDCYEDEDLFHALLKELVMSGGVNVDSALATDDPIALSQAYLRVRRLRSRQQRKHVDRRASKGRKLRFQPHEKLAVFMAPLSAKYPQREAPRTDELFKSLFGSAPRPDS